MVSRKLKPVFDFLPLAVFLIVFKWSGLLEATAALVGVTFLIVAFLFAVERRIALIPLVTACVVGVFGGLTLYTHNEMFVKMKPTVINTVFAAILFFGCLRGKGYLHLIMGSSFSLTEHGWWLLSLRFGFFFLAMALLNELVWRTMPTDFWVNFKIFGLTGLTFLFALLHAGFIHRFQQAPTEAVPE